MCISIFLENFKYNKDKKTILESLNEEPNFKRFNFEEKAIVAAMVEKLANDNDICAPKWVNKMEYFLKLPLYEMNTKNPKYQELLIKESPNEFKRRNIFCGSNVLDRI